MNIRPLCWPEYWLHPTSLQRILLGIPFIGIDKKTYKQICAQLRKRDPSCVSLWGKNQTILRCLRIISPLIQEYFHWPNIYFIPDDPCNILLWNHGDGMELAEFLTVLSEKFSVENDFSEQLLSFKYGELISKLCLTDIP